MIEGIVDRRLEQRLRERDARDRLRQVDEHRLLTSSEVAKALGTTRRALAERFRRARAAGEPHPLELLVRDVDGVRRWRAADVEQFIAGVERKGR
jgi:hypothetical protein